MYRTSRCGTYLIGAARHEIETLIGLDRFYAIEEETVEEKRWGTR
jgi:hypothetical protein